jgi:hypothetical protein
LRKTPPPVNPTTDRRTAKIRTKSLIRKSRNRTQRELSPSYPPSDGESRIENGNLAAKRRRSAEKIGKHGLSRQKRILPASGTLRRPARENPELCQHFPAKINFSPARNRQSLPPHSRRIQTIKGLRTQPTAGSVPARRKRLLRKPNLRSPPLPATDSPHGGPDRQPPQLLPQPPQPALPASKVVRFSPNEGKRDYSVLFGGAATRIPLRRKDLRESRHYRHGLRPRTNERRMTDIEIYDCRGKSIFLREPVPNKRRIRP